MNRRTPGKLLKASLEKMRTYITTRQSANGESDPYEPIVEAYLSSVLLPAKGSSLNLRTTQELKNLAKALDLLLKGDVAGACDVLIQRFKSVEVSPEIGFAVAKHLELVSSGQVTAMTDQERESIMAMERRDVKTKNLRGTRTRE